MGKANGISRADLRKAWRAKHIAEGLCIDCCEPSVGSNRCGHHLGMVAKAAEKWRKARTAARPKSPTEKRAQVFKPGHVPTFEDFERLAGDR